MEKKITKKEMFAKLREKVKDNAEMVKFIDHELELLNRKNSSDRKLSGNALANVGLKEEIIKIFSNEPKRLFTATEIQKSMSDDYTIQRVSALLKQLRESGQIEKVEEKRRSFFKLAE